MASGVTTVTTKGQLTIPIEIRRALGIEPGAKLSVEQQGNSVVLRRAESVADRTAGIFASYAKSPPLTPNEERQMFELAVAEEQDSFYVPDTQEK